MPSTTSPEELGTKLVRGSRLASSPMLTTARTAAISGGRNRSKELKPETNAFAQAVRPILRLVMFTLECLTIESGFRLYASY